MWAVYRDLLARFELEDTEIPLWLDEDEIINAEDDEVQRQVKELEPLADVNPGGVDARPDRPPIYIGGLNGGRGLRT